MKHITAKILGFCILSSLTYKAEAKTVVTTYVMETQEKRKSTRWTLTEWLKIKERMKLMDLWLAMVSNPKKDKFAPELSVAYQGYTGELETFSTVNTTPTLFSDQAARMGRVQFWFTNLVSSTTGLRTPNIDLGFDYQSFKGSSENIEGQQYNTGAQILDLKNLNFDYTSLNLRIFGRNIQDTSLVLKYGQYNTNKGFEDSIGDLDENVSGVVAGVETYFYFLNWLGIEGNYLKFGNGEGAAGSEEVSGKHWEYGAFLEVYNLRLGYGVYDYTWNWKTPNYDVTTERNGTTLSIKLQF